MKCFRPWFFSLIVCVCILGCGGAATIDDLADRFKSVSSYALETKASDGETLKQFVKVSGGKIVKIKVIMPNGWSLVDFEKKVTYFSGDGKRCTKMPLQDKVGHKMKTPAFDPKDYKDRGAVVGSETVDGVDCLVIETVVDGDKTKVWVDKTTGLTRKAGTGKDAVVMKYSLVNAVPDKEFELPKGIKILDMGAMMKGIKKFGDFMGGK